MKTRFLLPLALALCFVCRTAHGQQTSVSGDIGGGMFRNPVIPSDYSDPDVIRVGEDYYGIASTFCFSPGMILIHSKDLVNWEIIGHVVDDISFLNPDLGWERMKGYYNGIWAGSLRYHDGVFYCHFATPKGGWFVARTDDIRGKWKVEAMRDANGKQLRGSGWDDPCPIWDEDGQAYIIASNFGKDWFPHIFKMSADGTQLLDAVIREGCDLSKNMELIGGYVVKPFRTAEAAKLYKWNGTYYIYFSEVRMIHGNRVRVPVMRRSKDIYGPYEEMLLLHSQGKEADKEPNQGAIVDNTEGNWFFVTHHGTGDFDGRVVSVLPVEWKDGWPMIGVDSDADGVGEMVWEMERPVAARFEGRLRTSDDFSSGELSPQWEFNHQPREGMWTLAGRPGFMRLHAFPQLRPGDFFSTGNVLSQRYVRWDSAAAGICIDVEGMADGQEAGLAHFNGGKDYAGLGVRRDKGRMYLVFSRKYAGQAVYESIIAELPGQSRRLWLRSDMDFDGIATFSWSRNGKRYRDCGEAFRLKWGSYRGDRIGIYTFNNRAEDGFVDVDWFRYERDGRASCGSRSPQ